MSEKLIAELNETWEEKLRKTEAIKQERSVCLLKSPSPQHQEYFFNAINFTDCSTTVHCIATLHYKNTY